MASSLNLQGPLLHKSHFLGSNLTPKTSSSFTPAKNSFLNPTAKFNLFEIMGGRGLLKGEENLQKELQKTVPQDPSPPVTTTDRENPSSADIVPEDAFDKELLGLTGGFPGGEKGLQKFIEQNPPPKKSPPVQDLATVGSNQGLTKKPKPPQLPLLMPGMIAIVKNKNSPYYMYCGIVQRITDGKAGVLFEGGNWDRLITFNLNELERREKGPPMVSPRSVVLEAMNEKDS
ncbi:hypothetical protein LguiA_015775 [Lonicera macranthoides]